MDDSSTAIFQFLDTFIKLRGHYINLKIICFLFVLVENLFLRIGEVMSVI